jgi:hypothetical protein
MRNRLIWVVKADGRQWDFLSLSDAMEFLYAIKTQGAFVYREIRHG